MKTIKIFLIILLVLSPCKIGHSQNASAMFSEATSLFLDSRYKEAITSYNNFIDLFPKHNQVVEAYYNIGESYYRSMNFPEAEKYFKRVIIDFPKSILAIEARNRLGDSYQKQELFNKAIAEYQKVIEMHPNTLYADYAKYAINWLNEVEMSKISKVEEPAKIEEPKKIMQPKSTTKKKPKEPPKPLLDKKEKEEKKKVIPTKITINLVNSISNQNLSNYINQIVSDNFNIITPSVPSAGCEEITDFTPTSYFFSLKNKVPPFLERDKNQIPVKSEITLEAYDAITNYQAILLKAIHNTNKKVLLDKEIKGNEEEINKEVNTFIKDLKNLLLKKQL